MNTSLALIILGEILFTLFIVWGFMHEDKFIAFEDEVILYIRRRINAGRRSKEAARRRAVNSAAVYKPVKPVQNKKNSWNSAA